MRRNSADRSLLGAVHHSSGFATESGGGGQSGDLLAAAEELRDIARVLSITANTDANIREAIVGILNIAERLERGK